MGASPMTYYGYTSRFTTDAHLPFYYSTDSHRTYCLHDLSLRKDLGVYAMSVLFCLVCLVHAQDTLHMRQVFWRNLEGNTI